MKSLKKHIRRPPAGKEKSGKPRTGLHIGFHTVLLPLSVIFAIWLVQLLTVIISGNRIWHEELLESSVYVYFLKYRLIARVGADRVGWYAPLLFLYQLFGMTLETARYLKLALWLLALTGIFWFVNLVAGTETAYLALFAVGLSPVVLYLNALAIPVGTEFLYLPLMVVFVYYGMNVRTPLKYAAAFVTGTLLMFSLLTYPVFLFYIPAFLYFCYLTARRNPPPILRKMILCALAGSVIPFLAAVGLLQNRDMFLMTVFRGGGKLTFDISELTYNIYGFLKNFFVTGNEYISDLAVPDFSGILPLISLFGILAILLPVMKRNPAARPFVMLAVLVGLTDFCLAISTVDFSFGPGLRRFTPVYAAVYALYLYAWKLIRSENKKRLRTLLLTGSLLLLPLHHILAIPANEIKLRTVTTTTRIYFFGENRTPDENLAVSARGLVRQPVVIDCPVIDDAVSCRNALSLILYGMYSGYCEWNHIPCKGFELRMTPGNRTVPLTREFFSDYRKPL